MLKKCAIAVAAAVLCGCASIIEGGSQPVTFTSMPEAAQISIVNKAGVKIHTGTTPATVPLKRGAGYFRSEEYTVTIDKPGFESQKIYLAASVNGWYVGNILVGGLIGMLIVDPLTGAMYSFPSKTVNADLTSLPNKKAAIDANELQIALLTDIPEQERSQLQLIKF